MAGLAAFFLTIASIVLSVALGGYTVSKLWEWFIVPAFALPLLSLKTACGIRALVSFLSFQTPPDVETKKREPLEVVLVSLFTVIGLNVIVLVFGWALFRSI